ncbi:YchJ family protein [Legionella nagasakiensis]|uniref:YchJ family protein n=1 Tax=Legionella nagasakiensis TaxID=535290 RepID=UPI0010547B4A|nr:YchJ family protein [Legionella nagasakiensis]
MTRCPCGSNVDYSHCCGLYLEGEQIPLSPEALMRSRYTAYSLANIDYIKKTMRGRALNGFHEEEARLWAEQVVWLGLQVVNARHETPEQGYVEFIARFMDGTTIKSIHEISEFHRQQGQWYYVDGCCPANSKAPNNQNIGRNRLCPCGSQRKFKHCHGKGHAS